MHNSKKKNWSEFLEYKESGEERTRNKVSVDCEYKEKPQKDVLCVLRNLIFVLMKTNHFGG